MSFLSRVVDWFTTGAHWHGSNGIPMRLLEHVRLSGLSVLAAMVLALPVGLILGHVRRGGFVAVNVANIGRAIPSFALLVLAQDVFGIGFRPAFIALVALAVPPIVTNTYIGVRDVEAEAREAAVGMGMTGAQVLRTVELPLALPLIVAGIRTSTVNVIATATLAALIAGGGLGRFIVDGLAQRDSPQAFGGAVLVAAMAVVAELALGLVQRRLAARSATVASDRGEEELVHALVP